MKELIIKMYDFRLKNKKINSCAADQAKLIMNSLFGK